MPFSYKEVKSKKKKDTPGIKPKRLVCRLFPNVPYVIYSIYNVETHLSLLSHKNVSNCVVG